LVPVGLIEQVLDEHPGWNARQAVQHLRELVVAGTIPTLPSERTLLKSHSAKRRWFALWNTSLFVPADILTALEWPAVFDESAAQEAAAIIADIRRIMNTDELGTDVPYEFNDLYMQFSNPQGRMILVGDGCELRSVLAVPAHAHS